MAEEPKAQRVIDAAPIKLYANGFGVFAGSADLTFTLHTNNRSAAAVNMSYTTAKSFAAALSETIAMVEAKTGQQLMKMDFIDSKINHD